MDIYFEIISLIVLVTLFVLLLRERKQHSEQEKSFLTQINQDSKESIARAESLISTATQKAEAVIEEAEKQGLNAQSAAKEGFKVFDEEYRKSFSEAITQAKQDLQKQLGSIDAELKSRYDESEKQYSAHLQALQTHTSELDTKIGEYMKTSVESLVGRFEGNLKLIQERALSSQEEAENTMKSKISDLLLNFEQSMSSFLSTSQEKSLEAVNLEVKSAKELIETYKSQQLALIDENIVAVLEKTLSLVLRSKLTLKDQVDLVFESLEKAKAEKFLV
ncbi:hypothetical protein A2631_00680 [Candidatus Daviesbacteria bacterium RIFCSPHIGHO2_01_FULL_44_29]|uniref:Uncharacterized protein n=1 Tax=Candidatus Daviesbacteria bacterium RIFCSPHIGHO2_02_FULL_43_12 TaxID=1797776 RepID=A0A1F5KHD2_9BACT|nr:MAG: hypothetical protein A2631_00680 [Candidatus Daviesbacteria bacterium RIFCSPHIGHO2_01_FULL_44_29]OGE40322.1 MAG: hypothetical protein A3D25_02980 [Candidatus Daviesbacteria bacterium RIFCSPHIGHO2_02_FULL_43_12]OGE69760.1 MAG: hypothetical protein A3B55_02225 [Candidatus Daviesbacteria bacterium RIFCSPLOWO2_01_FULL_43_15]